MLQALNQKQYTELKRYAYGMARRRGKGDQAEDLFHDALIRYMDRGSDVGFEKWKLARNWLKAVRKKKIEPIDRAVGEPHLWASCAGNQDQKAEASRILEVTTPNEVDLIATDDRGLGKLDRTTKRLLIQRIRAKLGIKVGGRGERDRGVRHGV